MQLGGSMFKNHLKIAIRSLVKYGRFSVISILGLAIGLSCFILIMLWVQDELSYDSFHKNADRIYLALRNEYGKTSAVTSQMLASALKDELPEVINATSFVHFPESIKLNLRYQDRGFEEAFDIVDSEFFDMFSFDFIDGNSQTALLDPHSIVLTESMARKYFGNKNALGESLNLTFLGQTSTLKVTGVLKNIPHNSHIQREVFIPTSFVIELLKASGNENWRSWGNRSSQTFILIQNDVDISAVEHKITDCERRNIPNQRLENLSYSLLPLKKIHLHANNIDFFAPTGDVKYVYIFTTIAGIIVLIASINHMNLSNALLLKRPKEIGIQKVVGAHRSDLIRQYFGETLLLTFIALVCALMFAELLLPVLNRLSGKPLSISYLNSQFLLLLFLITLLTGSISGLYPAIFISGLQPIQILKGKFHTGARGTNLQKVLTVFQFTLSIIIIICTIVVFSQLDFIKNTNLGYDKENIVCVKIKGDINSMYDAFRRKTLESSDILSISRSEPMNANSLGNTEGIQWPGKNRDQGFSIWVLHCDYDFASTYKIDMDEGRFYSDQFPTDGTNAYVLNQAAVEAMGLQSPIGQEITVWSRKGTIIGITKNFHFDSFHHKIEPLIFRIPNAEEQGLFYRALSIRTKPNSIHQSLAFLEDQWKSFYPTEQFDYYFVDENLNTSYRAEQRMGKLFGYFSFLAIFIACLGLYGLTALTIEQKNKCIGIHKILGATVLHIVFLLSKDHFRWILFSNIIAWPITYFAINKWLQEFAYRININGWMFALAGAMTLTIGFLTVIWQVVRAATANPIDTLRYE
jgi:putative ABC transport system permease protein